MAMNPPGRDRAIDVARLGALLVVMFGHCALLLATIDSGGVRIGNLIGAVPAVAPLTWIVQVMPLFFLAGGAAGAYGYRAGTAWGTWLFTRAQRLCRPVFWYLAAWSLGLLVVRLLLGARVRGRPRPRERGAAVVPRRLHRRAGLRSGVDPVAVAAAPSRCSSAHCWLLPRSWTGSAFAVGAPEAGVANFVIVWLIPVAIGVAYARRLIGARAALVVAVAAFAAQMASSPSDPTRCLWSSPAPNRSPTSRRPPWCSPCTAPGCRARSSLRPARSGDGHAAAGVALRVGRQRGSDDALPVAHPGHRDRDVHAARFRSGRLRRACRRTSGACSRCAHRCSPW